jgi:hypothetical protein
MILAFIFAAAEAKNVSEFVAFFAFAGFVALVIAILMFVTGRPFGGDE